MQEPSEVSHQEQNLLPHAMETTAQEIPPNQVQDFQPNYPTSISPAPPGNLAPPPYPTTLMPEGQPPVMHHTAYPASQVVTAHPPGTYPTYYSSVPANLTQQQPMYTTPMAPQPYYPPTNMPQYPITTAPGPHPQYQTPPPYPNATVFGSQQQYTVYQATNAPPVAATQPSAVMMSRPKDYLCWSILSLIFCFCPLGLVAVVFSSKTSDAVAKQDWISARKYSSNALLFNFLSLVFGVIIYIVIMALRLG